MAKRLCGSRSHVAVVDRSLMNMRSVHSDLIRSSATLKDRAALNMHAWLGGNIFGCH